MLYTTNHIPKKYKNTRKGVALVNAFLSMEAFKEAHDWMGKKKVAPQILNIWSRLVANDPNGYFRFKLDTKSINGEGSYRCEYHFHVNENSIVLDRQYINPIYFYPSAKSYICYDVINSDYLIFKELQTGTLFQGTSEEVIKYHEELNKIK